jgi:hypothetical protein
MSRQFDALVTEALDAERELRSLSDDKPSIRGWVNACLKRGGLLYEDIEVIKANLGGDFLRTKMVDSGAYVRDIRKYIMNGSLKEPPAADRIAKLYFAQRDGAISELGGEKQMLFALFAIAAEAVYIERPELFDGIDDIDGHRERLALLENRRKELYAKFPGTWKHDDLWIGRITSDGAALICFSKAPGEVPVHPPASAAERLVDYLLRQEGEAKAA